MKKRNLRFTFLENKKLICNIGNEIPQHLKVFPLNKEMQRNVLELKVKLKIYTHLQ